MQDSTDKHDTGLAAAAGMTSMTLLLLVAIGLLAGSTGWTKSPVQIVSGDTLQDFIIQLDQPGAATVDSFAPAYQALRANGRSAAGSSTALKLYLQGLQDQRQQVLSASMDEFGRELQPKHEYEHLLNGFAASLTPDEARRMARMPGVLSVFASRSYELHLDAGPALIGAPDIWNGVNSLPTRGEGVVIGIIDTGINWEHPFFADVAEDGFVFSNPLGLQLGLCSNPQVQCNNKLIGVYDFTTEGEQIGRDLSGHGSHVASIAAGNRLTRTLTINGLAPVTFQMSGVAQRANIISYKACQAPADAAAGTPPSCQGQAMVDALDQALADGVDVFNFSIGGAVREDPWLYLRTPGIQDLTEIFLDLRESGLIGVVSAGNSGPGPGTISTPANGPWSPAIGNVSHGREQAKILENLSGGAAAPPASVIGVGATAASATLPIVHAKDFGNALCGAGPAELGSTCGNNTGASNPFPPGTFNGQIVVCDRGTFGRVEKGRNVQLAGAAGMILANTNLEGEDVVADQHCLPAMHIGDTAGDALRDWLDGGSNHRGRIGPTEVIDDPFFAGILAGSSSVGPNTEIAGVLKPNLVAPGTSILAASFDQNQFLILSGTSMSAPHITGAFALLKSANPDWNNNQILSALETTAIWPLPGSSTPAGIGADQRGAGVPVLGNAVRAGLYLNVTEQNFRDADPTIGGKPADLNLPGIQLADCRDSCQTTRRLTDMQGGGQWTLSTDQPFLQVSPSSINLAAGQSAVISVTATRTDPNFVGIAKSARVMISGNDAQGAAITQTLPVSVLFSGGNLPELWQIQTNQARGRQAFTLADLVALPNANWQPSRLKIPTSIVANLAADSTPSDPYDNSSGTSTELFNVPANTLRLRALTLASPAQDVDLFVGQDLNGNQQAEAGEEICRSISVTDIESCIIDHPQPGNWWIRLQVFAGSGASTDRVEARYAVLDQAAAPIQQNLFVRAPGVTANNELFTVNLAWDLGQLGSNQTAWGVLGIGTSPGLNSNVGLLPVQVTRTSLGPIQPLPLFDGETRVVQLAAGSEHNKTFIDVVENVVGLQVNVQGNDSELQVVRVPFDQAFANQPGVLPAPQSRSFSAPANSNGQINFSIPADALSPGRWYLIPSNGSGSSRAISITASLDYDSARTVVPKETAYTRDGSTRQGVDFGRVGNSYGLLWYTFDEQGQAIFYNLAGPVSVTGASHFQGALGTPVSNGQLQQRQNLGRGQVTFIDATRFVFSYDLLGRSGSELMQVIANTSCPRLNGQDFNIHGVWDVLPGARGGVSMLATAQAQGYIRYFFDDAGQARWVSAFADGNVLAQPAGTVFQAQGNCPDCSPTTATRTAIGQYSLSFAPDLHSGTQNISFDLLPPLSGQLDRVDSVIRLSDPIQCLN